MSNPPPQDKIALTLSSKMAEAWREMFSSVLFLFNQWDSVREKHLSNLLLQLLQGLTWKYFAFHLLNSLKGYLDYLYENQRNRSPSQLKNSVICWFQSQMMLSGKKEARVVAVIIKTLLEELPHSLIPFSPHSLFSSFPFFLIPSFPFSLIPLQVWKVALVCQVMFGGDQPISGSQVIH